MDPNLLRGAASSPAAAAALAVAAAVAVPIVVFATGDGDDRPTRQGYLAQVNEVCKRYEAKLQRIDAPSNFANPLIVRQSVGRALPLIEQRLEEIRLIEPPEPMRRQVARMLVAADAATAALRLLLAAAAAEDLPRMGDALTGFLAAREAARGQSAALGISC